MREAMTALAALRKVAEAGMCLANDSRDEARIVIALIDAAKALSIFKSPLNVGREKFSKQMDRAIEATSEEWERIELALAALEDAGVEL